MVMAEANWGSTTQMPCVHCGTLDVHYWSREQLRWKCKCCGKRFSATSGTVLADHKLSLKKIFQIALSWSNGASGMPALQLRRDWGVAYNTVFTLLHRLREGLCRSFNVGLLMGTHEMDGMDVNGRRYKEKRNKPQAAKRPKGEPPKVPDQLKKPRPDFVGPPKPDKFDKAAKQPFDRRLIITMVLRGQSRGLGSAATRIAISKTESGLSVTTMALRHASAESAFMTDEDTSYAGFGHLFDKHDTIRHSEAYSKAGGISNNLAESLNARLRRGAEGIYLNQSTKYTHDYSVEQAWRSDYRRTPTGKRFVSLLRYACAAGMSLWWRGFSQGNHRAHELLLEGNEPAKGRGKHKGWKDRPPR
jgi:transposase-like protein